MKLEAESGVMGPHAKKHVQPQKQEEARDGFTSKAFRGRAAWLIPRFQTCGQQSWERIHLACFKPSVLWSFVIAAIGN